MAMATYKIVDEVAEIQPALGKLRERGETTTPFLAVDCEGENLSRKGVLSIVSVATDSHVYLFDIKKLGARVFDQGLRALLEDPDREKLMFDCRSDADCLCHQFKVKLGNVFDLQLMQSIYEETHPLPVQPASSKAQSKAHFQPKLRSFLTCLEVYVKDEALTRAKADGKAMMDKEGVWLERPLNGRLLAYAANDVRGFFPLYSVLKPGISGGDAMARVRQGSQRYLDFYRSLLVRTYNDYELNSFVPWRLLPRPGFPASYPQQVMCMGCKRGFPREDFLPLHVQRAIQKCPVCRKIYAFLNKLHN